MHSVGPLQGHMSDEFIEEVVGFWEVGAKSACNFWRILLSFFTVLRIFIAGGRRIPWLTHFLAFRGRGNQIFKFTSYFLCFLKIPRSRRIQYFQGFELCSGSIIGPFFVLLLTDPDNRGRLKK